MLMTAWVAVLALAPLERSSDVAYDLDDDAASYHIESQVCVYVMHFHTRWGLLRSNLLRSEMDLQGIPYNTVPSKYANLKKWPVKCLTSMGYAGNWLSLLTVWTRAVQSCKADWVIIFESDAVIPRNFMRTFANVRARNASARAIWMDERGGAKHSASGCCTVATAWHRSTWPQMIADFDPFGASAWHNNYHLRPNHTGCAPTNRQCLTDWYLCNVVQGRRIPALSAGVVRHPPTNRSTMLWLRSKMSS